MPRHLNFTKAALDALPPAAPGKRDPYHDSKTPGLVLRVTDTGVKTFSHFRRVPGGEPERIGIGRYPDVSIENARRRATEINAQIAKGVNPAEIKRARKAEMTFAELFAEYLERHSKPRKRTWQSDEANFRLYLQNPLGSKKFSAIDRAAIARVHTAITKAGHGTTANRVKALVSSVFSWGISVGLCEDNPAKGIRANPAKSRDRFLQSDELPRFFAALTAEPNPDMRDYFLLALLTGVRRGNLLAARWDDISLERGEWRIPRTKNDTPQIVTLGAEALEILHHRKSNESEFVFPGVGKNGHLIEVKRGWARILTNANLSDLRVHDLRRTLGSWQAITGASLSIIGKSLNHRSVATTAIYARLNSDPVRDSLARATSAMLTAAGLKHPGKVVKVKP
jgi:integrase